MAGRPPKNNGIEYWQCQTNLFDDPKIIHLFRRYSTNGIGLLFYLWNLIYKNGYYYEIPEYWHEYMPDETRISPQLFCDIFNFILEKNLLHKNLYEKYHIITSKAIQQRWLKVVSRRVNFTICIEYWLNELPDNLISANSCCITVDRNGNIVDRIIPVDDNSIPVDDNSIPVDDNSIPVDDSQQSKSKRESKSKSKNNTNYLSIYLSKALDFSLKYFNRTKEELIPILTKWILVRTESNWHDKTGREIMNWELDLTKWIQNEKIFHKNSIIKLTGSNDEQFAELKKHFVAKHDDD